MIKKNFKEGQYVVHKERPFHNEVFKVTEVWGDGRLGVVSTTPTISVYMRCPEEGFALVPTECSDRLDGKAEPIMDVYGRFVMSPELRKELDDIKHGLKILGLQKILDDL